MLGVEGLAMQFSFLLDSGPLINLCYSILEAYCDTSYYCAFPGAGRQENGEWAKLAETRHKTQG